MKSLVLTPKLAASLDAKVDLVCLALEGAIADPTNYNGVWSEGVCAAFDDVLTDAVGAYMEWNRGTKRANRFDKYILLHEVALCQSR